MLTPLDRSALPWHDAVSAGVPPDLRESGRRGRGRMRPAVWSIVAGLLLSATAAAQTVVAPKLLAPEPPPPSEFGVGEPVPGVRPPMPVSEAPIEVPPGPMFWVEADYLFWRAKG